MEEQKIKKREELEGGRMLRFRVLFTRYYFSEWVCLFNVCLVWRVCKEDGSSREKRRRGKRIKKPGQRETGKQMTTNGSTIRHYFVLSSSGKGIEII